jgi:Flp pilus assembly protein TadD
MMAISSASSEKMFSALTSQMSLKMQMSTTMLSSGLTLYQNGNTDKAVAAFKQATAYAPDNVDAYNYLAKAYLKQGKTTEAINAYKISLSIDRRKAKYTPSLVMSIFQKNATAKLKHHSRLLPSLIRPTTWPPTPLASSTCKPNAILTRKHNSKK